MWSRQKENVWLRENTINLDKIHTPTLVTTKQTSFRIIFISYPNLNMIETRLVMYANILKNQWHREKKISHQSKMTNPMQHWRRLNCSCSISLTVRRVSSFLAPIYIYTFVRWWQSCLNLVYFSSSFVLSLKVLISTLDTRGNASLSWTCGGHGVMEWVESCLVLLHGGGAQHCMCLFHLIIYTCMSHRTYLKKIKIHFNHKLLLVSKIIFIF